MHVIKKQEHLLGVAQRWSSQYRNYDGSWKRTSGGDSGEVYKRLVALLPPPPAEMASKIDEIIGNRSWTTLTCDMCSVDSDALVSIEPELSEHGLRLCANCLRNALGIVDEKR